MPDAGPVPTTAALRTQATPASSRRGRTRTDRLALIDLWLARELPRRMACERPLLAVDVGYGDQPATTMRMHRALGDAGLDVRTLGVEREAARVRNARSHPATEGVTFAQGSFELRSVGVTAAQLVRAMNVLRAYPLDEVRSALATLGRHLADGGLLVEGTTDVEGHVATAHLWRRQGDGLAYDGLLLCTDAARGFSPWLFRDHLPRDLRRHVRAPEPVHGLLEAWAERWQQTRGRDPHVSFVRSLQALAQGRADVTFDPWLAERGVAHWRPSRPSQRPEVFDGRL